MDNDGYLSDKELEAFQERCFAIPLTTQSLHDVKQLIRNSTPGGVTLHGVTLKGEFLGDTFSRCYQNSVIIGHLGRGKAK